MSKCEKHRKVADSLTGGVECFICGEKLTAMTMTFLGMDGRRWMALLEENAALKRAAGLLQENCRHDYLARNPDGGWKCENCAASLVVAK